MQIQHLFQRSITWEYTFGFCHFSVLAVQAFYDICCIHNPSDLIRELEETVDIFPVIFPVTDGIRIFLPPFFLYSITDAYVVYDDAGEYQHCLCFAHCRRYFIESIPLDNKGKEIPGSKGAEGREFINLLFPVEEKIKELSFEERKEKRLEASKPIPEAFWSWVEKTSALPTTNEKLTKALTYAINQREGLEMFLTDGRIPLSNNLCEANIKPFATARRAWLFADSQKGA